MHLVGFTYYKEICYDARSHERETTLCIFIYLFTYLFIYLFTYLFIYLLIFLVICLFIYLLIYLFLPGLPVMRDVFLPQSYTQSKAESFHYHYSV